MSDEPSNKETPTTPRRGRMGNYWIYVLLFAVGLSLFMFNGGTNLEETTWKTFSQKMLAEQDVAQVKIVNQEFAEIYIKKDALSKAIHTKVAEPSLGNDPTKGPHYFLRFGSIDHFEEKLAKEQSTFQAGPVTALRREWSDGRCGG